ncbi:MAG: type II toxin-antitoxin system VapC family toxin [Syntrophales bacterium]|nr:type II toxin-antitoxin system VapC family toxin [Syntrophales bacterium]MDD5642570.1 type II toxin-antitoxin system VapC family toxin [Syntrophales bacterium]
MARFINPLFVNNLIDANIVHQIAAGNWEPIRQILELYTSGEIQLIIPHSVRTELLSIKTPADVRTAAQDIIFTDRVALTPGELIERDRLLHRARGNAELKNIEADLSYVAEAAKYGGYFITLDKRLLKRAAVISEVFVSVDVVAPELFLERVADATKDSKVRFGNEGQESMHDIDSIIQMIEDGGDIKEAQKAIIDLIISGLKSVKDSLGYWEKLRFANAIIALSSNINLRGHPKTLGLRLCINNLAMAFIPASERNETYARQDSHIDSITYEQLMEAIKSLRNL